ncbi:hypothetical protein FXO37_33794 [Capsicum annuum]|nr:hypothetical protein FXO37_33794 [Capsicum annuum]
MASNKVITVLFITMVTIFAASNVVVAQDEEIAYKECYENGMRLGATEESLVLECGVGIAVLVKCLVYKKAPENYITERLGEGFCLQWYAIREGADAVIAIGGDGTLHKVHPDPFLKSKISSFYFQTSAQLSDAASRPISPMDAGRSRDDNDPNDIF